MIESDSAKPEADHLVVEADLKGWKTPQTGTPDDRDLLVSNLRAMQAGDDEQKWSEMYGNSLGRDLTQKGIEVEDLTKATNPYDWYSKTISFPFWNLPFAAFLLEGFRISPDDAGMALKRSRPHVGTNTAAAKLVATYDRLKQISGDALDIDAAKAFRTFGDDNPPPALLSLLWAARGQIADNFANQRADLMNRERALAQYERDAGKILPALYVLAVKEGWENGQSLQAAAAKLQTGLGDGLVHLDLQRAASGKPPVGWKVPDQRTLERWLGRQRNEIGEPPKKRGRPKK